MRKTLVCCAMLCLAAYLTMGVAWAQSSHHDVLLHIGKKEVPLDEFRYLYNKNYSHADTAYTEQGIRSYLDLYIKFKLKVAEAYERHIDTSRVFRSEFDSYRKQLAKPYLTDRTITDRLMQEAYSRLSKEVRASHILIRVSDWLSPADTLQAYSRLLEIKEKALQGVDFGELAREYSEDPSAAINAGDLGYFTSMQMVYEFESAAYNTPVGQIVGPVRTRFGYHLIKVTDKVEARGSRKVSHIMVRSSEGIGEADSVAHAQKAQEIHKQLLAGGNWNDLCQQFSDDPNTKASAGELPWFSTGQMVPSFSEASFSLKNVGDISAPVKSPYGWHIIKLDGKKPVEDFKDVEGRIRQRINQDSRAEISKKLFTEKLKRENGFKENPAVKAHGFTQFDSTLTEGAWKMPMAYEKANEIVFTIGKQSYDLQGLFIFVAQNQAHQHDVPAQMYASELYEQYVDRMVMQYEEEHLMEKYPEYKYLVNEYQEGMLLFDIMEKEVWSKAVDDTTGLRGFFERNRSKYQWGKRVKAQIFNLDEEGTLPKLKEDLKASKFSVERSDWFALAFAANDTVLEGANSQVLDKVAIQLRRYPDYTLELHAYGTSNEGSNLEAMAKKRAYIAKEYVSSLLVDPARISVVYVGNSEGDSSMVVPRLFSASPKALEAKYNAQKPLALEVKEGWFEKGGDVALEKIEWVPGEYTHKLDKRTFYVRVLQVEEPRNKHLEETKGAAIADYQNELESVWVEQLRKKHGVKVNEKLFDKFVKEEIAKHKKK